MFIKILFLLMIIDLNDGTALAARILGIYSTLSPSHHMVLRCYTKELAKRGHELVVITTYPYSDYPPESNIKQIDIHNVTLDYWNAWRNKLNVPKALYRYHTYLNIKIFIKDLVEAQLQSSEIKAIFDNEKEHFDLVVVLNFLPLMVSAAERFKAPFIIITSATSFVPEYYALGTPLNPIYYPDNMNIYIGELNFWEKIDAICYFLWERFLDWRFSSSYHDSLKKSIGADVPTLESLMSKVSVDFINIHQIIGGIRPSVPTLINLGGIHLKPKKPLPQALQHFLDNSKNGVIYMSLGSNSKSTDLPEQNIKTLTKTFAKLPYNVVWKWENDTLREKPENVWISKWLPQQDLLGHPNVKAFITHGGLHSLDEAIHNKVPLVGMPLVLDQYRNVRQIERLGIGVSLDINMLEEEVLKKNLIKVIEDESYRLNIERLATIMKDKPESSMERAMWWTEYVIRNKGAHHLSAPKMSLCEYIMLDVIAMVLAVILLAILAIRIIQIVLKKIVQVINKQ